MPVYTPTTPRVLARDKAPPMFRPGNQANLEPAVPLNPSPTQSFVPGLGQVRSANSAHTGLDAQTEAELDVMKLTAEKQGQAQIQRARAQVRMLEAQIARNNAKAERAKVTGRPLPRGELRRIMDENTNAKAKLRQLSAILKNAGSQGGGQTLPPWKRLPKVMPRKGRQFRPLAATRSMSVPTPDPLMYEPAGISLQQNRSKIMDMQKNIQPVSAMNGLGITQYVPAPVLLAGVAGVGLYFILRAQKRKRG